MAEFYSEVKRYADDLNAAGFAAWSEKLVVALHGSTSGEILPALRFHIRGLLEAESNLSPELRLKGKALVDDINSVGI